MGALAPLLLAAAAYWAGTRRVRRWPSPRTACFLAGIATLAVAASPWIQASADEGLSVHMVQHLLLVLAAPPLLLLGRSLTLSLRALPPDAARSLAHAIRSRPVRALTGPAAAWVAFTAVLLATHLPALYDATLRSEPLHALEHALYLWTALLLWHAALAAEPAAPSASPLARVLLLLAAMPPMALVGVWLWSADAPVYADYGVADQHAAGWIMWLGGTLPVAAATVALLWAALLREERRQRAREAAPQRGGAR